MEGRGMLDIMFKHGFASVASSFVMSNVTARLFRFFSEMLNNIRLDAFRYNNYQHGFSLEADPMSKIYTEIKQHDY